MRSHASTRRNASKESGGRKTRSSTDLQATVVLLRHHPSQTHATTGRRAAFSLHLVHHPSCPCYPRDRLGRNDCMRSHWKGRRLPRRAQRRREVGSWALSHKESWVDRIDVGMSHKDRMETNGTWFWDAKKSLRVTMRRWMGQEY